MKISAVIITKDEARNIARCISSLRGVAEEVLVVDTFSEDGTQEIARNLGARVIEQEWLGYAATKNFANGEALHGYVLSLDADEALSDGLYRSILAVKESAGPDHRVIYSFNRLAYYCGEPIRRAGWYPDRKARLFPKGGAEWQGAFVHERLVAAAGVEERHLEGDLLHYTYYTVGEHLLRARRYAELAAEGIAASGKRGLAWRRFASAGWRFVKMYFVKGGILEGWRGWSISRIGALEVYWKYDGARRIRRLSDK